MLLALAGLAFAADLAQLRNGFSIRHERREVIGPYTRLYLNAHGDFVDVLTTEIAGVEPDETPAPAAKPDEKTIQQHVSDAGRESGIDPAFLNSVIRHESAFNPNAVSNKGAQGLMQLMPETASKLGVQDSFDPRQNISGGTAYLRELLVKYNGNAQKALAAYNAGPRRVSQYNGVPPYRETQAYVAGIIRDYNKAKLAEAHTGAKAKASRSRTAATKKRSAQTTTATKPATPS